MEPSDSSPSEQVSPSVPPAKAPGNAVVVARPANDLRELRTRLIPNERVRRFVNDAVELALDSADRLGDTIAEELGLRAPAAPPTDPTPPAQTS